MANELQSASPSWSAMIKFMSAAAGSAGAYRRVYDVGFCGV